MGEQAWHLPGPHTSVVASHHVQTPTRYTLHLTEPFRVAHFMHVHCWSPTAQRHATLSDSVLQYACIHLTQNTSSSPACPGPSVIQHYLTAGTQHQPLLQLPLQCKPVTLNAPSPTMRKPPTQVQPSTNTPLLHHPSPERSAQAQLPYWLLLLLLLRLM